LAQIRQTNQPIILHPLQNNPLEAQTLRYLSLNILTNNVDNKNIKEIKASQKQIVTAPKDYPELLNIIKIYHSMASILFGEGSALTVEIGRAIVLIKQEVSTIKVRITGDFQYPAKILYAFKICIQCWLCLCKQQEDRLAINDRIINMDQSSSRSSTAASPSTSPSSLSLPPPILPRKKKETSPQQVISIKEGGKAQRQRRQQRSTQAHQKQKYGQRIQDERRRSLVL
jgi:hypothetical protein